MSAEQNLAFAQALIYNLQPAEFGDVGGDIHADRGIRLSVGREPCKTQDTLYVSYQPPFGICKPGVAIPIGLEQSEEAFQAAIKYAIKDIQNYLNPKAYDYQTQQRAEQVKVEQAKAMGSKSLTDICKQIAHRRV